MAAQDAFPDGPDALHRALGTPLVAGVTLELHPDQAHRLETVAQEQILALRVDPGALGGGVSHVQPISAWRCGTEKSYSRVLPTPPALPVDVVNGRHAPLSCSARAS